MAFSQKYVGTGLAILGIIIAVGGIIGFFIIGHGIDMGLRDIKVLTNSSSAFQGWSSNVPGSNPNDPDNNNIVPITMQFTLFNLTNKADVLNGSIPIYQKVGPYVYQEYQLRFDANFTDNGNLVSFYESRYYIFDRNNTDASLDPATDSITAFNPIYTGVINTGGGSESSFYNFSIGQGLGALNAQLVTLVPPLAQAIWSSSLLPADFTSYNISLSDWVNATTLPGNAQVYVISSGGVPSGISATSAAALRGLFSSIFTTSILNDILTSDKAGLADLMQTAPDLTPQQASMFINWYRTWAAGYLVTYIESQIKASFKDIAYLQWGQGNTLRLPFSIQFFAKQAGINLPGPPEFFYATNPHTVMSLADVKNLMDPNTNPNAVTVGNNWMLYMSYANQGDWNSIVNTWNLSSITVAQNMTTYINYFINTFIVQPVEGALNGNGGLISTRTVNQWLWSYQDPLLVALQQPVTNGALFVNDTSLDFVRETTGLNIQYTGLNDTTVAQSFYQWNGTTTLNGIWNSTEVVNGTEGNNFPPDLDVTDTVYVWDSTTLRKASFVANETVTIKNVQLLRYRISPDMFNTSAKYYQSIYGFANMSSAYSNASLFISKPHFFQSAGDYLNKIQILNYTGPPNQDTDDIYLDVEPISGVTMNEVKQLQINVYIKSNSSFDYFGRYGGVNSDVMQPVFIAQELQQVTDYLANTFVNQVYTFENVKKIILWSLLGAGMLLLLVGCLLVIFGSKTEYESI